VYNKGNGKITNIDYHSINATPHRTAVRDLQEVVDKNFIAKTATTGKGTHSALKVNPDRQA